MYIQHMETHTENGACWGPDLKFARIHQSMRPMIGVILSRENVTGENLFQFHLKCSLVHTKTTPLSSILAELFPCLWVISSDILKTVREISCVKGLKASTVGWIRPWISGCSEENTAAT